jgi:hypothetical protein
MAGTSAGLMGRDLALVLPEATHFSIRTLQANTTPVSPSLFPPTDVASISIQFQALMAI